MTPRKEKLRRELLERRSRLEGRREKDLGIFRTVSGLALYRNAARVLFYVSLPGEADTRALLLEALREGREVYAPCCRPGGKMEFYRIRRWKDLRPGHFGVWEPDSGRDPGLRLPEEGLEEAVCLVPGVAFDLRGYRIGYGKGYYDRFLAGKEICCVGLCYRELVLPSLPAEEHDRRVGLLATEKGCIACGPQGLERRSQ